LRIETSLLPGWFVRWLERRSVSVTGRGFEGERGDYALESMRDRSWNIA